ncbi:MAG: HAD family phosphatase [Planctomycetota bacterium]
MSERAVIFDVDGVLVDSYTPHYQSWRDALKPYGVELTEPEFRRTFGRTSRDILAMLYDGEVTEEELQRLDDEKEALYREIVADAFPAVDGATELIDALEAAAFKLAVGSSGPPENVNLCLRELGRADKFGAAITGKDVTRGKPDPQVFLMGAERLGVPPARCAVVEDAAAGVEAANRAEMVSIGLTGTATREQLAHADLVVNSLRELSPEKIDELIAGR